MNAHAVELLAKTAARLRLRSFGLCWTCTKSINESRDLRLKHREISSRIQEQTRQRIGRSLRRVIRRKLLNGQLPYERAATICGAPGIGGSCDACGNSLTKAQLVMHVPSAGGGTPSFISMPTASSLGTKRGIR
jgi:hypothetical protein